MNFSEALELIKQHKKLARSNWNGFARKDWNAESRMFVYLVKGSQFIVNRKPLTDFYPEGTEITYRPHIDLRAPDGTCGVWTPSNSDLLQEDWVIIE